VTLGLLWPSLFEIVTMSTPAGDQLAGVGVPQAVERDGKGSADLTWDPSARVVTWDITSSGLTGAVTMAHFHNGAEGKNGPVVIWLTKKNTQTTGAIKGKATLTPAQERQFEAGRLVHQRAHQGPSCGRDLRTAGEIRGQVTPPKC
jgi:hypothetical protein